jgi:molecular chaperone GrpE (heat shock protein)
MKKTQASATGGIDGLRSRLAGLQERFNEVGTSAARTAAGLAVGGAPPSEDLLAQLRATNTEFQSLRDAVLEVVDSLEVILPHSTDTLFSLRDLVPIVEALETTLTNSDRHRRHVAGRAAALHVITRVQAIIHYDEAAFAPLVECQAKGRALHEQIARSAAATDSDDVATWAEQLRPFADLLEMIETEGAVDDEHFTKLVESVAEAFGRTLATAATRGRLGLR